MKNLLTTLLVFVGLTIVSPTALAQDWNGGENTATRPDLNGIWAQKIVNTSLSKIPIVGRVTTVTTSYLRVEIDQDGEELRLDSEVCHLEIDSSQDSVRTIVPPRFVRAMEEQSRRARLVETSDGDAKFVAPSKTTTLGVRLRSPSYENLPSEPDDPRIVDQDGDGDPGVTLQLRGLVSADLYVAQRGSDALRGEVRGNSIIDGLVSWSSDQKVLGSTSIFVKSQPESRPHPDEDRSYFRTTRIDASASCSDIVSNRDRLFDR